MADYDYLQVSDGTGNAPLMHITASRSVGASTLSVDSVARVPAKFIGVTGKMLSTGFLDPTTLTEMKCHVSGTSVIIDGFEPGSVDNGNDSTQVLIVKPNTTWANMVGQFIRNAVGLGTPDDVTVHNLTVSGTPTFAANSVSGAALAGNTVTPDKMLGIDLFGIGGSGTASPPTAGTGQFYTQVGTTVGTTNVSGDLTITFPAAFPNGIITVIACQGDITTGGLVAAYLFTPSNFAVRMANANTSARINWIAIGW